MAKYDYNRKRYYKEFRDHLEREGNNWEELWSWGNTSMPPTIRLTDREWKLSYQWHCEFYREYSKPAKFKVWKKNQLRNFWWRFLRYQ